MNPMPSTDALASARGYTTLRSLTVRADPGTWQYTVQLVLAKSEAGDDLLARVTFEDISGFQAQDLGGGLTQLLLLVAEDCSTEGLERIRFRVRELERNALSLDCHSLRVEFASASNITPVA